MTDPNAAALPDVRAALLQARSVLLALALHPDAFVAASPTHGQSVDPDLMRKHAETLRVLEAALRSREGERVVLRLAHPSPLVTFGTLKQTMEDAFAGAWRTGNPVFYDGTAGPQSSRVEIRVVVVPEAR